MNIRVYGVYKNVKGCDDWRMLVTAPEEDNYISGLAFDYDGECERGFSLPKKSFEEAVEIGYLYDHVTTLTLKLKGDSE
jgi:hypothetical protein